MGIPDPEEPDEAAASDHKRKGDIAFVGNRYQEALDAYSQSLRHKTSNHVVWANRSAVYLRLKKPQDALEDARRARTLDESYTKVCFDVCFTMQPRSRTAVQLCCCNLVQKIFGASGQCLPMCNSLTCIDMQSA